MEGQFSMFDLLNMGGHPQITHEDQTSTVYQITFGQCNLGMEVFKREPKVVLGLLEGNEIGDSIVDLYPTAATLAEIKSKLPAPVNMGGKRKSKKKTMRRRR